MSVTAASQSPIIATPTVSRPSATMQRLSKLLKNGLLVGCVVGVLLAIWILLGLGGLHYYRTPLTVRAYDPAHRVLRPSGPGGQMFGVVGALLMVVPFVYAARKRIPKLKSLGSPITWLEVHLFCGVVGPVLVTFHTSFKFNGVVSAAYWSMVLVMASGVVGRFLFVRIPKTIRGVELTRTELEARSDALRHRLSETVGATAAAPPLEWFARAMQPASGSLADLFFGEFRLGHRIRRLQSELGKAGVPEGLRNDIVAAAVERGLVLRRLAHLQRTKQLFSLWHVFHMPLVYLMLIIVVGHVGVVLYLGYVPFRW